MALRRGGARNPMGEAAIMARASDQAAFQRAQLRSRAAIAESNILAQGSIYLETFRHQYASDSVKLARAWVSGTPGVRDQFNLVLNNLAQAEAKSLEAEGQRFWDSYLRAELQDKADSAANLEFAIQAASIIAAPFTGGASLAVGAAATTATRI